MASSASAVVGMYGGKSAPSMFELPSFQPPSLHTRSAKNRRPSSNLARTSESVERPARRLSPNRHHAVDSTQLKVPSVQDHPWIELSCLLITEGGIARPRALTRPGISERAAPLSGERASAIAAWPLKP